MIDQSYKTASLGQFAMIMHKLFIYTETVAGKLNIHTSAEFWCTVKLIVPGGSIQGNMVMKVYCT